MPGPVREREVRYYKSQDGDVPYLSWLDDLKNTQHISRIIRKIDRVELGNLGDHKSVGQGVQELRLHFGPGFRIYFAEDGDAVVVLLCGGDKSSQSKDIQRAQVYWQDYKDYSDYERRNQ